LPPVTFYHKEQYSDHVGSKAARSAERSMLHENNHR
jgi:hypothetical protein